MIVAHFAVALVVALVPGKQPVRRHYPTTNRTARLCRKRPWSQKGSEKWTRGGQWGTARRNSSYATPHGRTVSW